LWWCACGRFSFELLGPEFQTFPPPKNLKIRKLLYSLNMEFSILQGYRDASCLFMEMLVKKDIASSSSTYYEPTKSDYCLCLAIHAPRKGIIEVWLVANFIFLPQKSSKAFTAILQLKYANYRMI
jgi:hypothetical protein